MTSMSSAALFNPTEEHEMLRQMVADFSRSKVDPQAAKHDELGELNVELFKELGDQAIRQHIRIGTVTFGWPQVQFRWRVRPQSTGSRAIAW